MVNAVMFTCSRHEKAALIAAEAASAYYNVILAFDKDDVVFESPYRSVSTGFSRNGNLNGFEAARGIADTLLANMEGDAILKFDSDTVIKDNSFFYGYDAAGFAHPFVPTAMLGCCYHLSRQALEFSIEKLKKLEYMGIRVQGEDVLITSYASSMRAEGFKLNLLSNKHIGVWHPTLSPVLTCKIGNFGNYRIDANWHHESALLAMKQYADGTIDTPQVVSS